MSGGNKSQPILSLMYLKVGRLLSLTVQMRNLVLRIASVHGTTWTSLHKAPHGTSHISPDRSTTLMVLTCYTRLEVIQTRAVETLRDVQRRGAPLSSSDCLMPTLEIDQFLLTSCYVFHHPIVRIDPE